MHDKKPRSWALKLSMPVTFNRNHVGLLLTPWIFSGFGARLCCTCMLPFLHGH